MAKLDYQLNFKVQTGKKLNLLPQYKALNSVNTCKSTEFKAKVNTSIL